MFDELKYQELMDGLECSEILYLTAKNNTIDFRLDAPYFKKSVIRIEQLIKQKNHFFLRNDEVITGPFGSTLTAPSHRKSGFIPLVRSLNINRGFYVDRNELVYISEEDNKKIEHSQLKEDDIVLSRVGSIGYFARVDSSLKCCNISSNNIGIKLDKYNRALKHYVLTYLNTDMANQLIIRVATGNVQPKLTTAEVCQIPIPVFSDLFYDYISKLVDRSEEMILASEKNYTEAGGVLSSSINIEYENQRIPVKNKKNFSESFLKSGRLDAEYYQPKYESIVKDLNTKESVDSMCNLYDDNYAPELLEHYRYIELSNVGSFGEIAGAEVFQGSDLPTRARRIVKSGQVIVSSIEGSLQSCALITDEFTGSICSTGFYVIDSDKLTPETLLVLFKSHPIQALLKQRCSGTILTSINKEDFQALPIPEIDKDIQSAISQKVKESFALRKKSKQLLEYAKRAVEIAIEQDEETAIAWLNKRNEEIGA